MATCQTDRWVTYAPYVTLTVNQQSETGNTVTFAWSLTYTTPSAAITNGIPRAFWVNIDGVAIHNGSFNINGVTGTHTLASGTRTVSKSTSARNVGFSCSFEFDLTWSGVYGGTKTASGSIGISATTSHTVTYNANGGTGAPGKQTKWYGTTLTLSSVKPTRTGYAFQGWATSSGGSVAYQPGAQYGLDQDITLYAVWKANTYTVKYNANGGTGAPGNQTKTYGVTLKLSTTKPTRTNYNFKGWGTSASSTTVAYAAGANYTANAAITLYAIWELAYTAPRITNVTADRCTSAGTLSEEGMYAKVGFKWATDKTVSSIKIEWKLSTSTTYSSTTVSATGTSGTVSQVVGAGGLSTENTYDIRITVADSAGSSTYSSNIAPLAFPIDFRSGGKGVAIGGPASSDIFHVYMSSQFDESVYFAGGMRGPSIPENSDLNDYIIPGIYYISNDKQSGTLKNSPVGATSFVLEVFQTAGVVQRLTTYQADGCKQYVRGYYGWPAGTEIWSEWQRIVAEEFDSDLYVRGDLVVSNGATLTDNIYIRNNKGFYIKKTDGTNEEIFAINSSNGTRMGWTSGGLQGRVRKTLWTGTWNSGTITVSEHMYYNMFLIQLDGVTAQAVCFREARGNSGSYIAGGNNSPHSGNLTASYCASVLLKSASTTQLTYQYSDVWSLTDGWSQQRAIKKIEGVI